jgi:hypothetical protein
LFWRIYSNKNWPFGGFRKDDDEWPFLLAPGNKIVPLTAFGKGFLVELPPRSSWLSQKISDILPSDGVIFYTDGSLCEGRAGAEVFSDTWIKHPKLQTTKYLLSLPKKQLRILVSVITGHCCLNKHLHRMGLATSPVCASCQLKEETAFHFVCVCPTLATLRTRILGKAVMNALEFTEVLASAILRFDFQSGRLETNL